MFYITMNYSNFASKNKSHLLMCHVYLNMRTLYFLLFLFSYALILFNFENRRFSFVFPSVGKNLQFSLKTEGFLNYKSYGKASVFF